jgi:ATP-binding cassette subfamily B protein
MIPTWPAIRLGEAIEALARASGVAPRIDVVPRPSDSLAQDADALGQWIEAAGRWMGLEIERLDLPTRDVERRLRTCGPALLRATDGTFVALLESGRVLAPELEVHRVKPRALASRLIRPDAALAVEVDDFLEEIGVPQRRRTRAQRTILRECASDQLVGECWSLRIPPDNSWRAARQAGLPGRLALLLVAHGVEYAVWIASWWIIGESALQGRFDASLLIAWALLLLTLVPLRAITTWLHGVTAIMAGGLLKERLLAGTMRLEPEEIRDQGAGQMLGRVIESEAVEALALNGGVIAVVAGIELIMAAAVIGAGAGGALHAFLLLLWIALALILAWRYVRASRRWGMERLSMTQDLVERMVGHRTRLAQESPERWHESEDQALERYLTSSRDVDALATGIAVVVPLGWLILSLTALAYPFVSGASSSARLAVGIGGTLLAWQGFRGFTTGLWNITGGAIAWTQVAPLFQAAARPWSHGSPDLAVQRPPREKQTLVDAQNVVFRYPGRPEPVLRGSSLQIARGDRMVLEGPSGAGKSTFGSLLAGLRVPDSGLLLARGLDRSTLGFEGWRRVVAFAPQFHENHVFSGPLAFNLLMGRDGILDERNLEEAEAICTELGLRDLLTRMPGGLMQMVGESGWQLSHGERSRLFIARALLQRAEVIVLDESFAALDPANLRLAIDCVARRAPAAVAIAHQ